MRKYSSGNHVFNSVPINSPTDQWQLPVFPDFSHAPGRDVPNLLAFGQEEFNPQPTSPPLQQFQIPYVQPQELHISPAFSEPPDPTPSKTPLLESPSNLVSLHRQRELRSWSLTSSDMDDRIYRPRSAPPRRRSATTGRITPRSDKHARTLELNRRAATKCRNRQKIFVESLRKKCRWEEERRQEQTALVHALHNEVISLRNEVVKQSLCGYEFEHTAMPPPAI